MATASAGVTATVPPAIIQYDISVLEQRVADTWAAYQQKAEPLGIDFGRACYALRAKAEVVQGGTSFAMTLTTKGIPRRTAYYWIHSYEISIGEREPKPEKTEPGPAAPGTDLPTHDFQTRVSSPKLKVDVGLDTDELHVWEQLDFVKLPDKSRLWLVEIKKSGRAELLRTCDIFKGREGISRTKNEGFTTQHNRTPELAEEGRQVYDKLLVDAQDRLADLKSGLESGSEQANWFIFPPAPTPVDLPETLTTQANQDRESLQYLAKRFVSLTKAVQQVVTNKQRWSKSHTEYAELLPLSKDLIAALTKLEPERTGATKKAA